MWKIHAYATTNTVHVPNIMNCCVLTLTLTFPCYRPEKITMTSEGNLALNPDATPRP